MNFTSCIRGGIADDLFLADDKAPPISFTDGVADATDDIGVLTSRGVAAAIALAAGGDRGLGSVVGPLDTSLPGRRRCL